MKTRVAMLFGGKSVEHEVSVISGIQAYLSMDTDKYEVIPVYMTKKNEMYIGEAAFRFQKSDYDKRGRKGKADTVSVKEIWKKSGHRDRCGLSGGAWNQCGGRRIAGLFKDHRRAFCGL